ncbi:MAG: CoA-binding protein [Gemmatimonadaceae bacterium]
MGDNEEWRRHLVDDADGLQRIIADTKRIAVLGMKTDPDEPAYFVPEYAEQQGIEIVPVPVYYPNVTEIMGHPVYRRVADIPGDVDMVNVFRRSHDVPPHVDDILAKQPKTVWMQLGIRNAAAAERLAMAGIDVVQNRCLLTEMRRLRR